MPRISAATVAEHRQKRRTALLAAATEILVTQGVSATTPAAVGKAAGIARSSVYEYFESSPAIVAAIVEDAFPRANTELSAAVRAARSPTEAIDAYVRTWLRLCEQGVFRPAAVLAASEVPHECIARLEELFELQSAPLLTAIRAASVPDPELTCVLLRGMLRSAMDMIHSGASVRSVSRRTRQLVRAALGQPEA